MNAFIPPRSFTGWTPYGSRAGKRRLMLAIEGEKDTGKTEFAMSAPGPGLAVYLDRGFDATQDNMTPPSTRRADWAYKVVKCPLQGTQTVKEYELYWTSLRTTWYEALDNPDARSCLLDGDADSWELQRLATYGKLTKILPIMYTDANAARRAFIARAYDSGKIVMATSRVKPKYIDQVDAADNVVMDDQGKPKQVKSSELVRQGFNDHDYLWQLQIRMLYAEPETKFNPYLKREVSTPPRWGLRIIKSKSNTALKGTELWDGDCNFLTLVQTVYPNVDPKEWGF